MSRSIAPGTVSSERDLIEYWVNDAEPVDSTSTTKGYLERCIHSEILKKFPPVQAVIHSHSDAVVPYTISGIPLRPCFHMAGFLNVQGAPIFDIADFYQKGDRKDMLVSNTRFGEALASCFASSSAAAAHSDRGKIESSTTSPDHSVVLMRGHGFTVQGESIVDAVVRAVYTQQNAAIQTTALLTRAAHVGLSGGGGSSQKDNDSAGVVYLSEEEALGAAQMNRSSASRPWGLWLREIEAQGLYVNTA